METQPELVESSGRNQERRYSFVELLKDVALFIFVVFPEALERTLEFFSDEPPAVWLREKGISLSWLLIVTVPIGVIAFSRRHRTKATDEVLFVLKRAPILLFCFFIVLIILAGKTCNLSQENAKLAGSLSLATNGMAFPLTSTNMTGQIVLTAADSEILSRRTKQFAEAFMRTNRIRPKALIILHTEAVNSRHLARQIRDVAKSGGWDVSLQRLPTAIDTGKGIGIYEKPPTHELAVQKFWIEMFQDISITVNTGVWGSPIDDNEVVMVINDPDYFP